ncbi:uncharacterized protein LOC141863878 [Acropora palmata]|uniref:uncharacterized protein LOC141863878 n=1 Tax=Acropora palmata TaxID=6131 RepID=UPI003D9FCB2F
MTAESSKKINVLNLASEWGSSKGGLSTLNRMLAIQLAKFSNVQINFFVPKCSDKDKEEALTHGITIVEAEELPGYEELDLLSFPREDLQCDVVIGHGKKLGHQAQIIRKSHKCKWVQVVHTDPEELAMFKCYENPISSGEQKHHVEVRLCEKADFVVGVGPKLTEEFSSYLSWCGKDVFEFTPGVFPEFANVQQVAKERKQRRILIFGRGDPEDFKLKGFDIAASSVRALSDTRLIFAGAPQGKHEEITKRFIDFGIPANRLRVRGYTETREDLKRLFCEVDLVLMPSRTEGFGLTGLEALSAGLNVIVSKNSGFGEALIHVLPDDSTPVIDSEDPTKWMAAIKKILSKDRQTRLKEAKNIREAYEKKYSWAEQCKALLEKMVNLLDDACDKPQISVQKGDQDRREECSSDRADGLYKAFKRPRKDDNAPAQTFRPSDIIERIRQIYEKRERVILPLPWFEEFSFQVEELFTSPRIVKKEKTRGREAKEVTSMTGIFKPHKDCQKPQIVLIEGVSGMGKTTFCQKLAYDWATREDCDWDKSFPVIEVPLLLKCGEMKSSIWEAIDDQILPEEIDPELKEMFFQFLRKNPSKVLLLLDGLDEANPENLELCFKILERKGLPPWFIVVTSRHEVGNKVRRYSDTLLEIEGFKETDVECFIRKYFCCQDTEDLGEKLISKLRSHPRLLAGDLKELTRNPLNTLFLCVIFEDLKGDLPNHRTRLFIEIVSFFLRRYEKKKGFSSGVRDPLLFYQKELVILGRKALDSLRKGELHFEDYNEDFKKSEIIKFGFLSIQVGSNRRAPCHRYQFLHKSFQEFFAGLFLAFSFVDGEMKDNTEFQDPRYLDQLFQVFLFMSGIVVLQYEETALSVVDHIALIVNKAGHSFSKYDSYLRLALYFIDECRGCSESMHTKLARKFGKILDLLDLDLSNFVVFYNSFAATLSLALTVNTTVTTLNLQKTCLNPDGVDSISEALRKNNSLTTLDLSGNSIGDKGTNFLSEALAVNNSLSSLRLSSNSISNEGAAVLSMALKDNTSITTLILHDNVIENDGASSLSEALRVNTSLATLDLSNNSIECDGANSLSEALNVNSSLTTLNLSGNPIGMEGATVLSTTLRRNTSLSTLDLSGSSIDDEGTSFLFQAMRGNTSLTSLHLSFNSISNKGAKCISQALPYNYSLSSLYLDNNSIGDEGATSLSELLRRNTSLAILDLSGNFIGDEGVSSLYRALVVNTSLKLRL